jgi:tight adherence protein B
MRLALLIGLLVAAVTLWPVAGDRRPSHALEARGGVDGGSAVRRLSLRLRLRRPHGWRGRARRAAFEGALAELVAVLAAPLRAGVVPAAALAAAESNLVDNPALARLVRELVEATLSGGSAAEVWLRHADAHGSTDLRFVGQAWALSERAGAPLADALDSCEEVLRARERGRARVASAAAGPRASMAVLCLLPASGPLVGAAVGIGPASLYFSTPAATGSLVLGLVLAAGAWWWSRRILARVA